MAVMFRILIPAAVLALVLLHAGPASAACYADYKAKKDDPLRLHYGVIQIPDDRCSHADAEAHIRQRIQQAGWTLLIVNSLFGPEGLDERKQHAGPFFLRF